MGIPKFYGSWIRNKKYQNLLRKNLPDYVSSISIDMNGMLHSVAQQVFYYGEFEDKDAQASLYSEPLNRVMDRFIDTLKRKLNNAIRLVNPQDIIILAIDGVAPFAKIIQQRMRRWRSSLTSEDSFFDRNSITPGTDFMRTIDAELQRWCNNYRLTSAVDVLYSSHLVQGEGEHKIMDVIRSGRLDSMGGAHVIYGLDADLIILSLISKLQNVYLMREDIEDIVSIDSLRLGLKLDEDFPLYENDENRVLDDFALMMSLLGNDFLPHIPSLENLVDSLNLMFDIYRTIGKPLTYEETDENGNYSLGINWDSFIEFIKLLTEREPSLMLTISTIPRSNPSRMIDAAINRETSQFDYMKFRDAWYTNALGYRNSSYLNNLSELVDKISPDGGNIAPQSIEQMVLYFLTGIAWTYVYYKQGMSAVNYWYYYPYYHAPMLFDIYQVLTRNEKAADVETLVPYVETQIFTPVHQLLAVMPPPSFHLIPREVIGLTYPESAVGDYYPLGFPFELDGYDDKWRGIPIIPIIDPNRLIRAVQPFLSTALLSRYPTDNNKLYEASAESKLAKFNRDSVQRVLTGIQQERAQQRENYENRSRGGRGGYRGVRSGVRGSYRGRGNSSGGYRGQSNRGGGYRGQSNRGQGSYRGGGGYQQQDQSSYRGEYQ
ncbi:5'-3' exoribonuclease [Orpheovirus IHUMI-LCC2]|uniref:5'-3' exoribonuclease n=1 Tax=Orpheovirus IHUMI-LCC2 TaxID=2023057 RepID=A0A2I2L5K3_9VIRU|nr:5'-3' exoribonuclease [Orpheovirus IHUMI-LCC2]SNW62813.1 5'-3' exoribonuclease [Orpheovirus IHUMI-LCC2]